MEGHVLWSGLKQFRDLRLGQPNRFILKPALDTRPSILKMSVTPRKLLRRIAEITTLPLCAKKGYFRQDAMNYLTKEQQKVLCVIVLLLLMGLALKTWRIAHPSKQDGIVAK